MTILKRKKIKWLYSDGTILEWLFIIKMDPHHVTINCCTCSSKILVCNVARGARPRKKTSFHTSLCQTLNFVPAVWHRVSCKTFFLSLANFDEKCMTYDDNTKLYATKTFENDQNFTKTTKNSHLTKHCSKSLAVFTEKYTTYEYDSKTKLWEQKTFENEIFFVKVQLLNLSKWR